MKAFFERFYSHPDIRKVVGLIRYRVLSKMRGIKTTQPSRGRKNTLTHNLTAFDHIEVDFSMPRMQWLLRAVMAIETVGVGSKALIIGPRTENDILALKGFGISDVIGLDIISYSPYIDIGDMHQMPYHDDQFDIVVCGWTISYSTSPYVAIAEILRVVKSNGLVAFGVEHVTQNTEYDLHEDDRLIVSSDDADRINTCEDLENLLGSSLGEVFFRHDAPLKLFKPAEITKQTGLASSQVMLVASIKK